MERSLLECRNIYANSRISLASLWYTPVCPGVRLRDTVSLTIRCDTPETPLQHHTMPITTSRSQLLPHGRDKKPVQLCLVSHTPLSQLASHLIHEFSRRAQVMVIDQTFGSAVEAACERERLGLVDAFVSAGGNAALLREAVKTPVATIAIDGFDLMMALIEARKYTKRVGVVSYEHTVAELDTVHAILNIDIEQRTYRSHEETGRAVSDLKQRGITVVIGSSVVVEAAQQYGLHGILAYSKSGIRRGFEAGIELAEVARLENSRYSLINSVLASLQEAVLAVDEGGHVIAANGHAEAALGMQMAQLLDRRLLDLKPELHETALDTRRSAETHRLINLNNRDWVVRRSPIPDEHGLTGVTLTLYDANAIHEADTNLRTQRRSRILPAARHRFRDIKGSSAAMKQLLSAAKRYAATDLTILITGETGTGKEIIAQAIHNGSPRADRPFIAVNCAAFPEALLESELFGYEDGAFTGARKGGKRGLFEAAHTGTLFLDEIGDMPLQLQSRLLRVLQEREVIRLGGNSPIPIDVRVLAATHRPLRELAMEQRFREDLFYRLNILQLTLPPLREREEEILPLARRFVERGLRSLGSELAVEPLLAPLEARLMSYPWRGNIRELQNICERLAVHFSQFTDAGQVEYSSLAFDCPELFFSDDAQVIPMDQQIRDALAAANGNRQEAARFLGISRATLWRRMQKMSHETLNDDS